jgi:hypothetical protein
MHVMALNVLVKVCLLMFILAGVVHVCLQAEASILLDSAGRDTDPQVQLRPTQQRCYPVLTA